MTPLGNNILILEERRKRLLIKWMHTFHDLGLTVCAFIASYFIKQNLPGKLGGIHSAPNYYLVMLMVIVIWFLAAYMLNVYSFFVQKSARNLLFDVIKIASIGMIVFIAALYLTNIKEVSRLQLGIFFALDVILLFAGKRTILYFLHRYTRSEVNIYNVLIIGSKKRAAGAIGLLQSSKKGYNIIGCLDTEKCDVGREVRDGVNVIGTMEDLKDIILSRVVDEVIFAMPLKSIDSVNVYMLLIEVIGIKVRIFPDWHIYSVLYQPGIASMYFDDFHGIPTMILSAVSSKQRDLMLKSLFDYIASLILCLLLLPFFLTIAIMIKIFSSRGPVFFTQERVGLNGRKFRLYKFRTMVPHAETQLEKLKHLNEASGPAFKIKKDPRIIPIIGTILRKTSLDELPQLLNVLKGEMSLVGPRPPLPSEVVQYDVWQRRRLSMKPGLTCLWQIAPRRNELSFHQWMQLDLDYIDSWSLWLDFSILFKTALVVVGAQGR
jgi:exopolysaccharide biosynthesis polyprenyl glycosylphosphotransferase